MSRRLQRPPLTPTLAVTVAVAALWIWVRLVVFTDMTLPLTYVLPLMICVWTRRVWQLLAMAVVFLAAAALKQWLVLSEHAYPVGHDLLVFGATATNILIGTGAIYAIMSMRDRVEAQRNTLADQNEELRQQTEELSQQAEELQSQQEELAQQHEELETQGEELARQNEELNISNEELAHREGMLEALLQVTGPAHPAHGGLSVMCQRMLNALGKPASSLFVLRSSGQEMQVACCASLDGQTALQEVYPYHNSIAELMAQEKRTAYIDDLQHQKDLIVPHCRGVGCRSILATPLSLRGKVAGAVVAVSERPGHWTSEQFRLIEWIAGHIALVLETTQQQTELAELAARLRIALDSAGMGTWTYWMDDHRWELDERAQKLYGLAPTVIRDELLMRRLLHPEDVAGMWSRVKAALDPAADGHYRSRYRVKNADGEYRWLEIWGRVEYLQNGARRMPVRIIGVSRDITEDYRAQEAIRAAKLEAEQASSAKDHFLAVLSHELRTPLTPVIMSVSEMLQDQALPEAVREDLSMIRRNVELETRLIDDLLDVTRIARGKLELQKRATELRRVVGHATQTCMAEARNKGLELEVDLGLEDLPIEGDAARLQQVFWNLIKNAVKFTAAGKVRVACSREDSMAVVKVIDQGVGMEPEACSRIFNAFEQGGRDVTRRFGGLGLGLAITKAMVEMHGGMVKAHSDGLGRGATFTVQLPLSERETIVRGEPKPEPPVVARAGRVLLVEDHPDSARMLKRLLGRTGWNVKTAGDVATALRMARAEAFDVIVSDIGLPDGTGLDLMRQLRLEQPRLRGVALSGHGMESDVQQSREAGFAMHLVKPVDPQDLHQAIAAVLDGENVIPAENRDSASPMP